MTTLERIKKIIVDAGGVPDEYGDFIVADAKPGYVWNATGGTSITVNFGVRGRLLAKDEYQFAIDEIAGGLRPATPEEIVQIEYDRDEEWKIA